MMLEKYHGLGNDYLVYDCNKNDILLNEDQVRLICHRNFGVGSDGILVGPIFQDDKIGVRILNPDGSEAEKSGNGVRIFSKYLKDAGYMKEERFVLSTLGGEVNVSYLNKAGTQLRVSMGRLSFLSVDIGVVGEKREVVNETMLFGGKDYQCTCVSVGNPHCVIPLPEVSKELVCEIGKYSENAIYFPKRINTQIVKVLDRNNIQIEIFERGAGYTLASGSSSCAAAGAVYKLGLVDNMVTVHMPGGELLIEIGKDMEVFMTGSVCHIGKVELGEDFVAENRMQ
ncbi:MAG TPA: diaminopimelate epimerase [Lachnospiraceae bacterium]|nr:diaminopimelate epimerase [Lachnospiraceae bacterium]